MSLLLFIISVIAYGVKELQAHDKLKWMKEDFDFWGKHSDRKKYKHKALTVEAYQLYRAENNWYTKLFEIKYKEAWFTSTWLTVTFTDGFHLMQFLFKIFLISSLVTYQEMVSPVVDFIIYFVLFGITFTIVYKNLSR